MDIYPAMYSGTGVERFDGNPFIEALPPLERAKKSFLTNLAHYPTPPSSKLRRAGEVVRTMELSMLGDIIHPYPEYQNAGLALATILRESYVARNPLSVIDTQRRHALAAQGKDGLPFPSNWKSSAKGHFIMAISGMGKTTFARAFLLRYPQVIKHERYKGRSLQCHQVVYLVLRVPHDATLKTLCLQFFAEIDKLLATEYFRRAIGLRQVAPMVQLMHEVATAVSLGFLVVDEAQNLRNARSGNASFVLNLFSEVIERLGISLLVLATPAVQSVIEDSVRNARKLVSYGHTVFLPMKKDDLLWHDFCDTYWQYSFVKRKGVLTKEIRDAWHRVSAGNTAFAALAFLLAQRNEIGMREVVDVSSFERTATTDLAFLQPAISALHKGTPEALRAFDDLLFSPKYQALRRLMGVHEMDPPSNGRDAFEDACKPTRVKRERKSTANVSRTQGDELYDFATEDPLRIDT